jgi:hypothetical protein
MSSINVVLTEDLNVAMRKTVAGVPAPRRASHRLNVKAAFTTLASGDQPNRADVVHYQEYTVAGGASLDLNVAAALGSPTGSAAESLAMARVKLLRVSQRPNAAGANSSGFTVGGAPTNPAQLFFGAAGERVSVKQFGRVCLGGDTAGVTIGTSPKNLRITNDDATNVLTVSVLIVGVSA